MSGRRAQVLRCANCDAAIPLEGLPERVTCGYCGHEQPVDPALVSDLVDYRRQVQDAVDGAEEDRRHAEAWKRSTEQLGGKRYGLNVLLGFLLIGGTPMLASGVGIWLITQGHLPPEKQWLVSMLALGGSVLGMILYFAWYAASGRGRKKAASGPGATLVTCPACGAATALAVGQALETCPHCGASLVAGNEVREEALEAVRDHARAARMERLRAERSGMVTVQSMGMSGTAVTVMVGGIFAFMIGTGCVVFTALMIMGREPWSPAILILWGMLAAILLGVGASLWWTRRRKRRVDEGVEALARRFDGRVRGGLGGTVDWLNTWWAGPYDVHALTRGPYCNSVEMTLDGYAALVHVDPVPAHEKLEGRAVVMLACDIPGVEDGIGDTLHLSSGAREQMAAIQRLGFEPGLQEGGILLRADDGTVKALVRTPGAVEAIGEVLVLLAPLARSVGGAGVDPIP